MNKQQRGTVASCCIEPLLPHLLDDTSKGEQRLVDVAGLTCAVLHGAAASNVLTAGCDTENTDTHADTHTGVVVHLVSVNDVLRVYKCACTCARACVCVCKVDRRNVIQLQSMTTSTNCTTLCVFVFFSPPFFSPLPPFSLLVSHLERTKVNKVQLARLKQLLPSHRALLLVHRDGEDGVGAA